jgi:hypothetical protein
MKKVALLLFGAVLLFILVPCPAGAKISVSLKLDRSEATLADSIKMVVSVSGTRRSDSQIVLNGLEPFHVTRGGTSRRVEIINGRVSAGIEYTYAIQPKKVGAFKIGPVELTLKGKTYKSNIETLRVVKPAQSPGIDRGPLFLSAVLSSKKVYVEEQTIYSLRLYRRVKVGDVSLSLSETEHLVFKQLGKPLEYQSVYNDRSYQVLEVRYALIPSKEGTYVIGPSRMNMTVFQSRRRSPRSFFDDPFFSFQTGRPQTLSSEHLELTVLPLPLEGRPSDFTGLVGDFKIESKLEPSTIKRGESATLTVLLKGRGNVNRIPDLKMPELEQTKVYADQPVLQVEPDAKGLAGSKTMKWALVPEKEGIHQIPPLTVSFFDTKSHRYRVVRTSPFDLTVLPGKEEQIQVSDALSKKGQDPGSGGPARLAVKELGRDILPVHTSIKDLTTGYPAQPEKLFFWLVLFTPLFVNMVAFCAVRFRRKSIQTLAATKAKKAAGVFIKKCRQGGHSSSDLISCIREYLNERFVLSLGSVTPDEAAEILRSMGATPDTAQELREIFQRLEDAVYTGKGHEPFDMGGDIPKLLKKIERETR